VLALGINRAAVLERGEGALAAGGVAEIHGAAAV
jgi:hypothetical protein